MTGGDFVWAGLGQGVTAIARSIAPDLKLQITNIIRSLISPTKSSEATNASELLDLSIESL
jgi:hypothetical protein